jgi:DNA-binding MarR family transcriptional regulator
MGRSESEYTRQILQAISSGERVTQRSLAKKMNVALGLTNLLIRRLVHQGYLRVSRIGTRHVRYLMTPAGVDALARACRSSLQNTVHLYTETRQQIRDSLAHVSDRCPTDAAGQKRVVFYGAGDVAEIAYVSLQSTDLTLVGIVDDCRTGRFFNHEICSVDVLSGCDLRSVPYGWLVVTVLNETEAIRVRLADRCVPAERVFWL